MNRGGLPEILHCLNAAANSDNAEMSVLERQRSRQKWQPEEQLIHHHHHQQQQQQLFAYNFGENEQLMGGGFAAFNGDHGGLHELLMGGAMKPDPGIENGWEDEIVRVLNYGNGYELEKNFAIQRTFSCPPNVAPPEEAALSCATAGKESSKKRKAADKALNLKVVAEEKSSEKKMKGFVEEDSKTREQNSNSKSSTTTATNSKGPSPKASEVPKPDYIHVRARRGQATDSHSLAERVRREKISERMKYLQDLVPGCNKITGKAGMLDEIINYVQSLQRQVEFLSMKLAAINPRLDFDIENYVTKQSFTACMSNVPVSATSSEMVNQAHLHFNSLLQGVSCSGLEMVGNPMDVSLRRTISAPVSIPQAFLDSSNLNIQQIQHLTWEDELQNLYSMQ